MIMGFRSGIVQFEDVDGDAGEGWRLVERGAEYCEQLSLELAKGGLYGRQQC